MVRHDRSVVYLDAQIERRGLLGDLLHHLDARRVESGANCCLWLTDDPAVFVGSTELNGCAVVSPIQLYLDLKVLSGRGEEAAQAVLRTLEDELGRLLAGK